MLEVIHIVSLVFWNIVILNPQQTLSTVYRTGKHHVTGAKASCHL